MMSVTQFFRRTDIGSVRIVRRATITAVVAFTVGAGSVVFVNSVADSALVPSARHRTNLMTVVPEGWAFFTRSPREMQTFLYRRGASGREAISQRHADPANYFGLARFARAKMVEVAALLEQVAPNEWSSFAAGIDPESLPTVPRAVTNPAPGPLLCGNVLLIEREPVPWAWSRASQPIRMPGRLVEMSVSCKAHDHPARAVPSPRRE